ncbi:MAG: N-acetylmuramoyl-L-alanine amidase [Akkermansia sp.]|nr:N-acetylmuramoyl-L-alanine amidase [Akkermansia sp.]
MGTGTIRQLLILGVAMVTCLFGRAYAQSTINTEYIDGVEYVRLADICRTYNLRPKASQNGMHTYGGSHRVSLIPARQDFYVNNYRYVLSYPIKSYGGELMISSTDVSKLVDPVLRPRFSKNASTLRTVVIDPGHGGHDAGAVSPYAREKDCNLAVALKLRRLLRERGYKVVMTRDTDVFLTLQQRVQIANSCPDSIFVSIHHNSGRRAAEGIETFTLAPHGTTSPFARTRRTADLAGNDQDSENIALATAVHSRAIKNTKAVDRGIQRARFSVLCTIKRPAILFEGGFVSNPTEGGLISSSKYQDTLALSICNGIEAYGATVCKRAPGRKAGKNSRVVVKGTGSKTRTSISGAQMSRGGISSRSSAKQQKGNKRG